MSTDRTDVVEWVLWGVIAVLAYCAVVGCSSPEGQFQCGRAADACRDVHYVLSGSWLLRLEDCCE